MNGRINDEALADLESKIAYLERANVELSDVVYRQQKDIDVMQRQLSALLQRFDSLMTEDQPRSPEEERPPHY